jgi:hypothetical protein
MHIRHAPVLSSGVLMKLVPLRAALLLVSLALPVHADVQVVQTSAPLLTAPWSSTVSLPKFNPVTGTLTNVRIVVRVNTLGNVAFENRSGATAQATASVTGVATATFPGGAVCSATTTVPVSVSAPAFDGVNDFGGTSGGVIANLTGTNTGALSFVVLALFTGTGNLNVSLAGANQSSVNVPANFGMRPGVAVGADVEITYVYTRHPDCDGNGIPDEFEVDSDGDGLPDNCDVLRGPLARPDRPGSLLVFPEYDSSPGSMTLLTVTNTQSSALSSTRVTMVFLNAANCFEFNRAVTLAGNDTFTGLTNSLNTAFARGYVYMYATSPTTGLPWNYNYLIGSELQMSAIDAYSYGYNAFAFEALTGLLQPTDLDADGIRDLDGIEYSQAPDRLMFPRFLGSTASRSNDLILINLTGGSAFTATVRLTVINDLGTSHETVDQSFSCWRKDTLDNWTGGRTTNSHLHAIVPSASDEVLGASSIESGWLEIQGISATSGGPVLNDPAILGLLIERSPLRQAAQLPYFLGEQANGDLLPHSAAGDP